MGFVTDHLLSNDDLPAQIDGGKGVERLGIGLVRVLDLETTLFLV